MSDTFDLGCIDCKKSLWIGQTTIGPIPFCLYYGEEDVMISLRAFLWEHRGHRLVFDRDFVLGEWGVYNPDNE